MTEPYYQDHLVTLYHGDCIELAETWTGADVLVTDPPYGVNFQSGRRRIGPKLSLIYGDKSPDLRNQALALWGPDKPALCFGTWKVAPPVGEKQRLIWWKAATPGMGNLTLPWGNAHEEIHVLGTGWNRAATGLKCTGSVVVTTGGAGGRGGLEDQTGHPTPKPVHLMESLIMRTPPGLIADPFAGSGATLLAARNLGRRVVGVEVEERHCETIARRLDQGVLDLSGVA